MSSRVLFRCHHARGRVRKRPLAQFSVDQEQPAALVTRKLELLHHAVGGRLLFHLLGHKPLKERICRMVSLL